MTEQTWTALGVIVALLAAGVGAYYMSRTNAREAERQRREAVDREVAAAVQPYKQQIAALNETHDREMGDLRRASEHQRIELRDSLRVIREALRDRERRIEQLEDELRRSGER